MLSHNVLEGYVWNCPAELHVVGLLSTIQHDLFLGVMKPHPVMKTQRHRGNVGNHNLKRNVIELLDWFWGKFRGKASCLVSKPMRHHVSHLEGGQTPAILNILRTPTVAVPEAILPSVVSSQVFGNSQFIDLGGDHSHIHIWNYHEASWIILGTLKSTKLVRLTLKQFPWPNGWWWFDQLWLSAPWHFGTAASWLLGLGSRGSGTLKPCTNMAIIDQFQQLATEMLKYCWNMLKYWSHPKS